jgi:hypothetical protein
MTSPGIVDAPRQPEPAGLGHGGHELVIGHPAHAGEHHRVLDVEDLGQSRVDGHVVSFVI